MHSDALGGPGTKKKSEYTLDEWKILTGGEELNPEEELVFHLASAQQHVEEAKQALENPGGAKRSLEYRVVLSLAHRVLTSLLVRELRS